MKKMLYGILSVVRFIMIITAIWMLVEVIHYKLTGTYIIYYRLLLRSAQNVEDQIRIIYHAYDTKYDWLLHIFDAYYIPAIIGASIHILAADTMIALDNKRHLRVCLLDVISILLILFAVLPGFAQ